MKKKKIKNFVFENLKHSRIDHGRAGRKYFPEVILAEYKTTKELLSISQAIYKAGSNVFITRIKKKQAESLLKFYPEARYNKRGRTFFIINKNSQNKKKDKVLRYIKKNKENVLILTAGTSDLSVALEAKETVRAFGIKAKIISDVGVAGVHRLLHYKKRIEKASVLIVIAGMDGALPSVAGGLSGVPLIAVPTSVGYGANFGGLSALLSMLNSCSSGLSVVNIDNGFGAAYCACQMIYHFTKKNSAK